MFSWAFKFPRAYAILRITRSDVNYHSIHNSHSDHSYSQVSSSQVRDNAKSSCISYGIFFLFGWMWVNDLSLYFEIQPTLSQES